MKNNEAQNSEAGATASTNNETGAVSPTNCKQCGKCPLGRAIKASENPPEPNVSPATAAMTNGASASGNTSAEQYACLLHLNIRVGTILSADPHIHARKPMHVLRIDFGPEIGIKTTSAQLTQRYPNLNDLVGRQITAVLNLPVKLIAGIKSEVLLLAATEPGGSILLVPDKQTRNGAAVR